MYNVRNDNGLLVAKVSNILAGKMMNEIDGDWTSRNFVKGGKRNIFVFTEDVKWGNSHMELFIWAGYYLDSYGA